MLILTTRPLKPEQVAWLTEIAAACGRTLEVAAAQDEDEFLMRLPEAEIVYGPPLRSGQAARATRLRWVQLDFAGVDKLPLAELEAAKIRLTNARGLHAATIADHVFLLLLAHYRSLPAWLDAQNKQLWLRGQPGPQALPGARVRELAGLRLAIVGLGHIGREVARRALAFGLTVSGTRRSREPVPGVTVLGPQEMLTLLGQADAVVLATPLTPETRQLMDARAFHAMPKGAYFCNVGRGGCVDHAALLAALMSGQLAGAGLDVTDPEPLPPEHPLWEAPNVIITPHVSGQLHDYAGQALELFGRNLERYLRGEPLQNQVNLRLGY